MSIWTMYWLVKLDDIRDLATVLLTIGFSLANIMLLVGVIISACMSATEKAIETASKIRTAMLPWFKRCLVVAFSSLLLYVALPSTKQMAAIIIVPALINSETIQDEAKDWYDMAKSWTEEQLKVMPTSQPSN